MADISTFSDGPIVTAIYQTYVEKHGVEPARPYLGASIIGKKCSRALWYDFRWAGRESFDGRMYRLFQSGHLAEPRFVADLRAIGVTVHDVDPNTGKQFGFQDLGGHMRGHCDGCAHGVPAGGDQWHLLEFKTHSDKSFKTLKSQGVEKAKPQHYDQMTWYMGQSGMTRGLYGAVNKNDDELHFERVKFDPTRYAQIQAKAERIIFAVEPPTKLSDDPKFYLCNWCNHNPVCHGNKIPAVSCRTCCFATPERVGDGRWSCSKGADEIPLEVQRTGCHQHLHIPTLIKFADAVDAGDGWILYKVKSTGDGFVVAAQGVVPPADLAVSYKVMSSAELAAIDFSRLEG